MNKRVSKVQNDGYISESTCKYLSVDENTRAGRFYLLPKIHKRGCPGRPVISGCNTPTEEISSFVDSQLKPLVPSIPSYVKDTNDFLRKLIELDRLPVGAILVAVDVIGLYPHIPHNEGLAAIRTALNKREDHKIPTDDIVELAKIVLTSNNFEFNEGHYLQKLGTAIGTKMAPSYANIFMHELETKLLEEAPVKPDLWLRYIDDLFMVWTKGEEGLKEFLTYINQAHDTIKFKWDWSHENINYLDVQVINNNGKIETDLYTKPTDKHQYLFHTSCHPGGCKRSIPYAQSMRLRRICSTQNIFEKRVIDLCQFLVARGYEESFVQDQIQKAREKGRNEILIPREGAKNDRIPFIVTYNPTLPNIGALLREIHPVLHSSERCKNAIKKFP